MLYTLIIGPLVLAFEFIFSMANSVTHNLGISILTLSLVVNILVLPLYNRADELQKEEKDKQKNMEKWIRHIKKTFRGDEKMLIQQAYYRLNDYHPIYVIKSSVSLFLQIPFFIAAYHFLSGLILLHGASFGPIADLGVEDSMLSVGEVTVNVLPIMMTLINIISGTIYTKGSPVKEKIQLYGVALVFLVLLYHSPSGLVFYWTLNNLFSLGKHIFKTIIASRNKSRGTKKAATENKLTTSTFSGSVNVLFFSTGILLTIFIGGYIPLNVIKSSVAEFSSPFLQKNPVLYLIPSLLYSAGFFILWFGVFFLIAGKNVRLYITKTLVFISAASIIDYMFFKMGDEGLSPALTYMVYESPTLSRVMFNLCILVAVGVIILIIFQKKESVFQYLISAGTLALAVMTVSGSMKVTKEFDSLYYMKDDLSAGAEIVLSRNEKNVIVLMLDRAMGPYIPYIMESEPELIEKFDGFTYYPNTVSFGIATNFCTPSLFGGYEYTPSRLNERSNEKLQTKNDEALKVMPALFDREGYDVTLCDPPYAGYQWFPDLSIFDEYPDINSFNLELKYNPNAAADTAFNDEIRQRNFFCYAFMRCTPLGARKFFYNQGLYNKEGDYYVNGRLACVQTVTSRSTANGLNAEFMNWYYALDKLPEITTVKEESSGAFVMMCNGLTHEPMLLQRPGYEPASQVDNTAYDSDYDGGYTAGGVNMKMDEATQVAHYQTNVLALKEVAKWIDMMKEEGIYDNTRIIIVGDHGRGLGQFDHMIKENEIDVEAFTPLLLVKDFGQTGFTVSEDFMTIADVSHIALSDVIENPKNPFTGNSLNGHEKYEEDILAIYSEDCDVGQNNGNTFHPENWYLIERKKPSKDSFTFAGYR